MELKRFGNNVTRKDMNNYLDIIREAQIEYNTPKSDLFKVTDIDSNMYKGVYLTNVLGFNSRGTLAFAILSTRLKESEKMKDAGVVLKGCLAYLFDSSTVQLLAPPYYKEVSYIGGTICKGLTPTDSYDLLVSGEVAISNALIVSKIAFVSGFIAVLSIGENKEDNRIVISSRTTARVIAPSDDVMNVVKYIIKSYEISNDKLPKSVVESVLSAVNEHLV